MAVETPIFSLPGTLMAENDLSTQQYKLVELSDDSQVDVCDSSADKPIGVLQNDPDLGEQAEIMALGVTKIEAGSSIAAGMDIATNGSGQAVGVDQTSANADLYVVGYMLKDVSAAGNVGTAVINCMPAIATSS